MALQLQGIKAVGEGQQSMPSERDDDGFFPLLTGLSIWAAWVQSTGLTAGDFLRRLIAAVHYKVHTVLTNNGTHFTTPGNTSSAAPDIKAALNRTLVRVAPEISGHRPRASRLHISQCDA